VSFVVRNAFDKLVISECDHLYKSRSFGCLLVRDHSCLKMPKRKDTMILEKQLFLPSIWEGFYGHFHTIRSLIFYSEEDYSKVHNIQDSCQSSHEWMSQQIHPKARPLMRRKTEKNPRTSVRTLNV